MQIISWTLVYKVSMSVDKVHVNILLSSEILITHLRNAAADQMLKSVRSSRRLIFNVQPLTYTYMWIPYQCVSREIRASRGLAAPLNCLKMYKQATRIFHKHYCTFYLVVMPVDLGFMWKDLRAVRAICILLRQTSWNFQQI